MSFLTRRRTALAVALSLVTCGVVISQIDEVRWRAHLVALKAIGQLPDLSWREIGWLLPPASGVWLRPVVASKNPYSSLINRRTSPEDVRAGRALFQAQCAGCHGSDAGGATGPNLLQGDYRQGTSDWALFRTISQGIPGTPMQKRELPATAVWQLAAFVKDAMQTAALPDSGVDGERSGDEKPRINAVAFEQLAGAQESGDWLMYSHSYNGQRHSTLTQIRADNVAQLRARWLFQLPTEVQVIESTPLVVGNTMFVSLPPGDVWALDARSGALMWRYASPAAPRDLKLATEPTNRGLAILGRTLFIARIDAYLVALDADTGKELWKTQVADYKQGYSMTSAPLALRDRIVVGVAGGEFGIRGFLDAYSPSDGKRLWRFNTIPGPNEPGHETWTGTSWQRGGAPTWLTGSYDPELDLVYWGVGNPGPDFQGDVRPGDNLYSNSVIALDARSGQKRWHFQFLPHDEHDWDSAQIPVLADAVFRGAPRKLIYWANRNGFYYVLDRITGEFLHARPFVKQTWAEGLDPKGRPIEIASARPTREGSFVYPSTHGATNWWSPSYDPQSNTFFVGAIEGGSAFTKGSELTTPDGIYYGSSARPALAGTLVQAVRALDASTGELRWDYRFPGRARMSGLTSTAGGLVFGGDRSQFFALDSRQGTELWRFNAGDTINAAPITYLSDGRQQVTIVAGRTVVTFSLAAQ